MSEIVYDTIVTSVGELVPDFRNAGMLVFFGANAPEELHDICILHNVTSQGEKLLAGDVVHIGESELTILAVGYVASDNLMNLGHLNLKANGLTNPEMPGDVNIAEQELPEVTVVTRIVITRSV